MLAFYFTKIYNMHILCGGRSFPNIKYSTVIVVKKIMSRAVENFTYSNYKRIHN